MKKTRLFIFISALLLTLLMVVGCDVSPISDYIATENSCVELKLSIEGPNSREIKVDTSNLVINNYKIAIIPEWNTLLNGSPVYGQIGSRSVEGVVSYGENTYTSIDQISLGYVTPGKWTVYVAAFNKDNKVVLDGYTSTYINSSNNTVSVCLTPNVTTVSEKGELCFFITVPRLSENHLESYGVSYTLYNVSNTEVSSNDIPGYLPLNATHAWYYFDSENNISLPAGEYIIKVSLYDKKDQSVIGSMVKKLSIVSGSTTTVAGDIYPSEFVDAKLDYSLPVINAVIDEIKENQIKDNAIIFNCTDNTNSIGDYNIVFRWFIDGELVTNVTPEDDKTSKWKVTAISSNGKTSSITCVFNSYGKREVRCEVVYIPTVTDGSDTSKYIRFVGGDSKFVEIIPR